MPVALQQHIDLTDAFSVILVDRYAAHQEANDVEAFLTNNVGLYYDVHRGRINNGMGTSPHFPHPDTNFTLIEVTLPPNVYGPYGRLNKWKSATNFSVEIGWREVTHGGEIIWTQLPDTLIEALEESIDLTEVTTDPFSLEGYGISQLTSINKFGIGGGRCHTDRNATLSLLSDDSRQRFLEKYGTGSKGRTKVLRLKKFYRGGGSDALPKMSIESQTSKQIASGDRFFLFTRWITTLDQATNTTMRMKVLCLGTFTDVERISNSSKAFNFLRTLAYAIKHDTVDRLVDPDAYERKQKEKFGTTFHRWGGLLKLVDERHHNTLLQEHWDTGEEALQSGDHLKTEDFKLLNASHLSTTPTGRAATRARDALRRNEAKIQSAERVKHGKQRESERFAQQIRDYQKLQEDIREAKRVADEAIALRDRSINELQTALPTLRTQFEKTKSAHEIVVQEFLKNPTGPDWYKSLREANIIVKDITYTNLRTSRVVSIADLPDAATDNNYAMTAIAIITLAPTIIDVDKRSGTHQNKQIVGGPYEIILRKDNPGANLAPYCKLRPASMTSIFGWKPYSPSQVQIKPHPHVKEARIYRDPQSFRRWSQGWHACCLGELEPALVKAFAKKQPRAAVYAVLAWITSCDTGDDWGKSWDWFPQKSDVRWDDPTPTTSTEIEMQSLKIRLENADLGRFWEAEVSGKEYTARWGKLGSPGRRTGKQHLSNSAAIAHAEETIERKLNLGYVKIDPAPTTTTTP